VAAEAFAAYRTINQRMLERTEERTKTWAHQTDVDRTAAMLPSMAACPRMSKSKDTPSPRRPRPARSRQATTPQQTWPGGSDP
jgi:hypothetical protein